MLTRHSRGVVMAAALVFAAGVGLRVAYLDVPPIEFHPARQYRAALIARAWSETALGALTDEQQVSARQVGSQQVLEPPVMERLAVAGYELIGHEDLRVPRLVSIAAWMLAAVSAAWIVGLAGAPGWAMVVALAVALLLPYGIDASRAFMPDPLMTALTMLALGLMLRQTSQPSWRARIPVLLVFGVACYVKPMAGLIAAPALMFLEATQRGWRGVIAGGLTTALAVAPTVVYFAALEAAGGGVSENRFFPQLWVQLSFWTDWLFMLDRVVGLQALLVSFASLVVATGPARWLLGGAWLGYVLLGLTFSHHIHTHDYYSLPVIPLAAASIGIAVPGLLRGLSESRRPLAAFAVVAALLGWTLRTPEGQHPWGNIRLARLTAADYTRIGTLVGHSSRVATLEGAYGFPLAYHGRMGASQLSLSIDRAVAALQGQTLPSAMDQMRELGAEYFVGTVFPEVAAQPELATWLTTEARLVEQAGPASRWRYVVYDVAGR